MCCRILLKLRFPQLCQQCSDLKGCRIYVCVRETVRFYPLSAVQVRMNARYSACHSFCIYWSAVSLREQREDVLIPASAYGGVGQKKSKNENAFSQTDLSICHLEAWMTFWMTKAKTKGMWRGANILSRQMGALHQATGAGGTTVMCRMMTDGGWGWWEPCPVWSASFLSSPLSSSVPHPFLPQHPLSPPTTPSSSLPSFELHQLSIFLSPVFFSDHQDADLQGSAKIWPATTTSSTRQPSEEFGFKAFLSPAFIVALTKCEWVWVGWWNH